MHARSIVACGLDTVTGQTVQRRSGAAAGPWERVTSRSSGLFQDAGGGYFRVVARHSGKCLDVSGASTADGANVLQWTCGAGTNQQWQWVAAADGYFTLQARHSGKCLDVFNFSTGNGGQLVQWTCTGGTNQQWSRAVV